MRLLHITAALALCSTFSDKINVMAKSGTFLHITGKLSLALEMHARSLKISSTLILLDIHIDKYYLENSDPSALCHRKNEDNSKNTAGHFGALGSQCDSPVSLV